MRKLYLFLAAAVAVLSISSCKPVVTGQFLYTVQPAPETSAGVSTAWQMPMVSETAGEDLILQEIGKVAEKFGESSYSITGDKTECDKKIIAAVNRAMDADESSASYCTIGDYSGMTVVVYCSANDKGETGSSILDFVIYKRTYKAK